MSPLPEILVGNQYLDIVGILVPSQILVVLPVFTKFERHTSLRGTSIYAEDLKILVPSQILVSRRFFWKV